MVIFLRFPVQPFTAPLETINRISDQKGVILSKEEISTNSIGNTGGIFAAFVFYVKRKKAVTRNLSKGKSEKRNIERQRQTERYMQRIIER